MQRLKLVLARFLQRAYNAILPRRPALDPDTSKAIQLLSDALKDTDAEKQRVYRLNLEAAAELVEARQMAGAGPWLAYEARAALASNPNLPAKELAHLREANPIVSQGAFGDIELALQNVEWRREINLSWMEFSRWGIQNIMLISRLYYIKNPILRRLIDIAACYVFGRGVEVSSTDETANEVLKDFFERNARVLGHKALANLERQKFYDGNLFFAFFGDTQNTGTVTVRMMEATEMLDVVSDPEDADTPWYYRRQWIQRNFNTTTGQVETTSREAWYPALGYDPADKPKTIGSSPVIWETPILHRKCGHVAKWKFGCPIIYPALDWAKHSRRYLEACANIKSALAQFAMTLETKGGQQAIEGAKQQLQTAVGPQAPIWDTNPPAVTGATFVAGSGTKLQAFQSRGAGGDPEEVRQYKLMCAMVVGVPETFLSDVSTGNLATATTLDRPTELVFLERQEEWSEDLVTIAKHVLGVSGRAPSGALREAHRGRKLRIVEMEKRPDASGRMVYAKEAPAASNGDIKVMAVFPAIREGDLAVIVKAIVEAMTLDNRGGQIVGIDEKTGVLLLLRQFGVENPEDIAEAMYPESEYEPDRTKEPLPAPIPKAGFVQGVPQGDTPPAAPPPAPARESLQAAVATLRDLGVELMNGHATRARRQ